jgi:zinc protease
VGGPTFERVVIDGVPAYVGNHHGPVVAGLTFRVGTADEAALDRGTTALLAELAVIDVDEVAFDVGTTLTSFVVSGSTDTVADALASVCHALPAFDDDELLQLADTILDDPADAPSLQTTMLGLRFGAQSYGMGALAPFGLLRIDGDRAREWAAKYFTRDNATLWSTGPLAPHIALPLPRGHRVELPPRVEAECALPAWCPNSWLGSVFRDAVDCSIVAAGSDATTVALRAFAAELRDRLHDSDVATTEAQLDATTWAPELTHIALTLPTRARGNEGIECILGTIDDFTDLGPDPDELADAIAEVRASCTDPKNMPAVAEMLADDELRTGRPRTLDELLGSVGNVSAADVAAVFDEMRNEIMVAAPSDAEIVDPRFALLERAAGFALDGTRYRRAQAIGTPDDDARLIVGPDGVAYLRADEALTVCFDDCAAAVMYPTRAITLVDIDGTIIEIAESDWHDGALAFATIEAALPPEVTLVARRSFGTADGPDVAEPAELTTNAPGAN